MQVRFLSKNEDKIKEATDILASAGLEVVPVHFPIDELQSNDTEKIVRDKVLRAFYRLGHPVFVEQTGLYLERLNGFPGGLTQVFWDTIEADRFSEMFGGSKLFARTRIGFCDGRRVMQFEGEIGGSVSTEPRGSRKFQWDCVFIPDGYSQTFAEMGDVEKNKISMRRRALDSFSLALKGGCSA